MNKTACGMLLLVLAQTVGISAEEGQAEIKLTGIVHWTKGNLALLEIRERPPNSSRPIQRYLVLGPGEQDPACEVLKVDEKLGTVRIRRIGEETVLKLHEPTGPQVANRTLHLHGAPFPQVMEVYQMLSGRTVIRPSLAGIPMDVESGPALSTNEALQLLDKVLDGNGITAEFCGDKFVFIVPEKSFLVAASLAKRLPPSAPHQGSAAGQVLPPGMIHFTDTDMVQALNFYQELSGRTVLRATGRRSPKINVRTQTALSRAETLWLFESLFAVSDIALVPDQEKFVLVLPANQPVPRCDPKASTARAEKSFKPDPHLPAGGIQLQEAGIENVVTLYAGLLGRGALPPGPDIPRVTFNMRSQTALNLGEIIYAFDALAALNQLQFELVGTNQVQIARLIVSN